MWLHTEVNIVCVHFKKNNVYQVQDLNLFVIYWFYWYFVLCILQTGGWVIVEIYKNHTVYYEPFFKTFFLHQRSSEYCYLEHMDGIVSRETIIQTQDMGSSPSVGKYPSYWSVCEQKCIIPASSRYLTLSSDLPVIGQSTSTVINEGSDHYLISAIEVSCQDSLSWIYGCYFQVQINRGFFF